MKLLKVTLGVMTAIGGFVDIGNLVTSGISGARFGLTLVWALALGTLGMIVYGEMAGRVTAVSKRTVFHVVRDRLGVRFALVNLVASIALTMLTLAAELGGVGLAMELASSVNYLLWVPVAGFAVWFTIWRVPFQWMERILGLLGLALVVFVVALFHLPTDWHALGSDIVHPKPPASESMATWLFYAVSLVGAALVPFQLFFFSSGGIEEDWSSEDLGEMRANAFIGFPLGAVLSLAIMAAAVPVLAPVGIGGRHLGEVGLPAVVALGKVGLAFAIVGFFAATFAAAVEAALSTGYVAAQHYGWDWGKFVKPREAARFHVVCLLGVIAATALTLTTIDPVQLTLVSVVLGTAAIPLTFFPILVIANDREYMGDRANGRFANLLGVTCFAISVITSLAAVPLLIITRAGQ